MDSGDELAQFIGAAKKTCSFEEETPVATTEGPVPISEIDVGDQVLAWDEEMGSTGYYTVTAVWGQEDPVTVQLVVNGETIETTPEHPFYEMENAPWLDVGATQGRWTPAGELNAGDQIRKADGTTGVVQTLVFEATPQVMYNLSVADAHTYTVGDGQWVVHNACQVNYGKLDALSRPTGIIAELSLPLPVGTRASSRIIPPGFVKGSAGLSRGHLLAKTLGGSGNTPRNLVTLAYSPTNTPLMSDIEMAIRRAVDAGEVVTLQVTPIYRAGDLAPIAVTMEAVGDRGLEILVSVLNQLPK